jgi:arsenite methyltransferase
MAKRPTDKENEEPIMLESEKDEIRGQVRERYAGIAKGGGSCCGGSGCCTPDPLLNPIASEKIGYSAEEIAAAPEGANLGLGCGNPQAIAQLKPGETVVDLGSGGGFDCFLAARQVGENGRVIGIDMTPDMISKARAHAQKAGFKNVEFRLGEIEHLPVADQTADIIMSNCVINLSPDKTQVYADAYRVLRSGGRLAISDVVAVREIPDQVKSDFLAYSGCIAGAASVSEVERMLREVGFIDVKVHVKEESRHFIKDWFPGSGAENYVRSANIEAKKR